MTRLEGRLATGDYLMNATTLRLRELTWSAVCIALGLAIPVGFHAVGLGPTFLPMFLPILAAGLLLRPMVAGLVGLITPPVSAFLTGMPPLMPPVAGVMAVEGLVLAGLAAVLYRNRGWSIYLAAAVAVLAERVVMVLLTMLLAPLFGLPARWAALALFARGVPGVFLLVVAVPLVVRQLESTMEKRHAGH